MRIRYWLREYLTIQSCEHITHLAISLNSRKFLKDKCSGSFVEVSLFGDGIGMTPQVPVSLGRDSERVSPRQLRMTLYAVRSSSIYALSSFLTKSLL